MALPAFGVTHETLADLFQSWDFSDIETKIDRWIQQAVGDVSRVLRMLRRGYTVQDAFAAGSSSTVYLTIQEFIESYVGAKLCRVFTHEDPARATSFDRERDRLRADIKAEVEGLLEEYNASTDAGGFRPVYDSRNKSTGGGLRRGRSGRRGAFWSDSGGGCL